MKKAVSAFSLVELSIVLVILGLLTGGILAGQSLIRAAQLRAVSTEYSRYVASINSFRDKYFGWPGDLRNATAFWSVRLAFKRRFSRLPARMLWKWVRCS